MWWSVAGQIPVLKNVTFFFLKNVTYLVLIKRSIKDFLQV